MLLALFATLALASAAFDCPVETCPVSVSQTGSCSLSCFCQFPANETVVSISRNYGCTGINGAAAFSWVSVDIPVGTSEVNATYTTAGGVTSPILVQSANFSYQLTSLVSELVSSSSSFFSYSANTTSATGNLTFSTTTIPCQVQNVSVSGNSITWNNALSPLVAFTVVNSTGSVVNSTTQNSFTPAAACGFHTFSVNSSLLGKLCLASSASVTLNLSPAPTAPTSVAVTGVSSNGTVISFTPSWTQSNSFACTAAETIYNVTLSHQDSGVVVTTWSFTSSEITINAGTVTPTAVQSVAAALININELYVISVLAVSPSGVSTSNSATFVPPGFAPKAFSCPENTCVASNIAEGACKFECTCNIPEYAIVNTSRVYVCQKVAGVATFTWVTVQFPAGESIVIATTKHNNITNSTLVQTSAVAYNKTALMSKFVDESTSLFNFIGNTTTSSAALIFNSYTLPCQIQNLKDNGNYGLTWDDQPLFTPSVSPATGTQSSHNSYTPAPACGSQTFTVVSTLLGQTCLSSAQLQLNLSPAPTTPSFVNATGSMSWNETNTTIYNLQFVPVWGVSNGSYCTAAQITYTVTLAVTGTGAVVYTKTFASAELNVTGSEVFPLTTVKIDVANLTDLNAFYTLSVVATSPSGSSTPATQTFALPNGIPPSPPSSSSGLSNTVIAGIAVGATVGVVALALIIYKCSSSRKEYENLDSTA